MSAMDIELKKFLLRVLGALGTVGSTTELLVQQARGQAWPQIAQPDLEAHLLALADQRFVISYTPPLQAKRWKITPDGEVQLRILGFA